MTPTELEQKVRELRAQSYSPKQIARTLGVRPAEVAELVRTIAAQSASEAPEPALIGCWLSAGWSSGLSWVGHEDWREVVPVIEGSGGLVSVLVAREERGSRVSICTWLLDVYCLGAKRVSGPGVKRDFELALLRQRLYAPHVGTPVQAPLELVQHLVFGAVEYARGLGFEPDPDFERCRSALGAFEGPSAFSFGKDGKPFFVEGPHDDGARVIQTLRSTVGQGNFDFLTATDQLR